MAPRLCHHCRQYELDHVEGAKLMLMVSSGHTGRPRTECNENDPKCANYVPDSDDEVVADPPGYGMAPGATPLFGPGEAHGIALDLSDPISRLEGSMAPGSINPQQLSKSGPVTQQGLPTSTRGTRVQPKRKVAPTYFSVPESSRASWRIAPQARTQPGSQLEPMQVTQGPQDSTSQKRRAGTPLDRTTGQPVPPAQITGYTPAQQQVRPPTTLHHPIPRRTLPPGTILHRSTPEIGIEQTEAQENRPQPQQPRQMSTEEFHRFVPCTSPVSDDKNWIAEYWSPETRAKKRADEASGALTTSDYGARSRSERGNIPIGSLPDTTYGRAGLRERDETGMAVTRPGNDRSTLAPGPPGQFGGGNGNQTARKGAKPPQKKRHGDPSPRADRGGISKSTERSKSNLGTRRSMRSRAAVADSYESTPEGQLTTMMRVNSLDEDDDVTPLSLDSASNSGATSSKDSANTRSTKGSGKKKKRKGRGASGNGLLQP